MKIRIVTDFDTRLTCEECVNILPFGTVGEISFKKQMDGSANDLVTVGKLSKRLGGITLLGAETDNCGIKRRSVFVYENGKLLCICDQNCQTEKFSPAFGFKNFNVGGKKIGVLVDKDIYDVDAVKTLVYGDCNAIINLYADFSAKKSEVAVEFYSYVYGIDFILIAPNTSVAFNSSGEKILMANQNQFEMSFEKKYRDTHVKKRGL